MDSSRMLLMSFALVKEGKEAKEVKEAKEGVQIAVAPAFYKRKLVGFSICTPFKSYPKMLFKIVFSYFSLV